MNILLVGCGKGFGRELLTTLIDQNHSVFHITSQATNRCSELVVSWQDVRESDVHRWLRHLPALDVIYFNQNGSSLSANSFKLGSFDTLALWKQLAHWRQNHYTHCQLPFQIVHALEDKIQDQTRVIWIVSSLVVRHRMDPGFADYIGSKFQNYILMLNFSQQHRACFFAIDPGSLQNQIDEKLQSMQYLIDLPKNQSNGKIFNLDGTESTLYDIFHPKL